MWVVVVDGGFLGQDTVCIHQLPETNQRFNIRWKSHVSFEDSYSKFWKGLPQGFWNLKGWCWKGDRARGRDFLLSNRGWVVEKGRRNRTRRGYEEETRWSLEESVGFVVRKEERTSEGGGVSLLSNLVYVRLEHGVYTKCSRDDLRLKELPPY